MSVTVTQLNGDASFLLSFEPLVPFPSQQPFRIILDPWIPGPPLPKADEEMYSKSYRDLEKEPTRIETLRELPEPDLIIISQDRSDHCNKATLKQLPHKIKTKILAEPAAAKQIRSWKYFNKDNILSMEKWEDPRVSKRDTTIRIAVPSYIPGGDAGEVTVSFISQKRDHWRVHSAIGITYRPPPSRPLSFNRPSLTPPITPKPSLSFRLPSPPPLSSGIINFKTANFTPLMAPPTPPESPHPSRPRSIRSVGSVAPQLPPLRDRSLSIATVSPQTQDRSLSVIFSPHGITYSSLELYATTHLVTEAALPLTALLHCFDSVSGPWWRPGSINSGTPDGHRIATALGAKAWVSTHDAERKTSHQRWLARKARVQRYRKEDVRRELDQAAWDSSKKAPHTQIMSLAAGEEVTLTNEGLWDHLIPQVRRRVTSMVF